jgi:hypothetical protein
VTDLDFWPWSRPKHMSWWGWLSPEDRKTMRSDRRAHRRHPVCRVNSRGMKFALTESPAEVTCRACLRRMDPEGDDDRRRRVAALARVADPRFEKARKRGRVVELRYRGR